jgi:hypothetical protein
MISFQVNFQVQFESDDFFLYKAMIFFPNNFLTSRKKKQLL